MIHISKIDTVKNLLFSLYKKKLNYVLGVIVEQWKMLTLQKKIIRIIVCVSLETQVQACIGH